MTNDTYAHAVDTFERLLAQPSVARHTTPASLIRAADVPASSGYRHVATLEAEGFLRRDPEGMYLAGLTALRTGLRACCGGALAPVAEPIVTGLRQATQHTSFLGLCEELSLRTGPYSIGRETRHHQIQPRYLFENIPDLTVGSVAEIGLRYLEAGIARRVTGLLMPVPQTGSNVLVLGVLLGGPRSDPSALTPLLTATCEQLRALHEDAT